MNKQIKKQLGMTLVEVMGSMVILGITMAGLATIATRTIDDRRISTDGQKMVEIGKAADSYIKDNYSTVVANATNTTPALIRVADLVTAGKLPTGYTATNSNGQTMCILALEPTAGTIRAMVIAEGGTAYNDVDLGGLISSMDSAAGGIYSTATTTIQGALNGYSLAVGNYANANHLGKKCDGVTNGAVTFAAGHAAYLLWFANGDSTSSFLYRNAIPGRPELNQMQTNLDMTNNNIVNAGTVGLSTVVTSGAACTTSGTLAKSATGTLLVCNGATWAAAGASSYWGDPVANYASLPVCNAGIINQARVVQTPTTGSGPRAYICSGSSWTAVGQDDNGNMTIAGTATADTLKVSGTKTLGSSCVAADLGTISKDADGGLLNCVKDSNGAYVYVRAGRSSTNVTSNVYRWEDLFSPTVTSNSYTTVGYVGGTGIANFTTALAGCPNYVKEDVDVFQSTNATANGVAAPATYTFQPVTCPYVITGYPSRATIVNPLTDWSAYSDTTSTTPITSYHATTAERIKRIVLKFKRQKYDQFVSISANSQFMRGTNDDAVAITITYGDLTTIFTKEYSITCSTDTRNTSQTTGSSTGHRIGTSCIAKIPKITSPTGNYDYAISVYSSTTSDSAGIFFRLNDPQDILISYTTTYSDDQ